MRPGYRSRAGYPAPDPDVPESFPAVSHNSCHTHWHIRGNHPPRSFSRILPYPENNSFCHQSHQHAVHAWSRKSNKQAPASASRVHCRQSPCLFPTDRKRQSITLYSCLCFVFFLFAFCPDFRIVIIIHAMRHSLRLNGRENNVIAVHDDDCPRPAAIGRINQALTIASFLYDPFDWCRLRTYDCDDTIRRYDIAKAYVDEFDIHADIPLFLCSHAASGLLDVLYLLPQFLDFTLHINDNLRSLSTICLRTNGVCLTIQLLDQEIQLAANRFLRSLNDLAELLEMTAEPYDLFGVINLIGIKRGLLNNTRFINIRFGQCF